MKLSICFLLLVALGTASVRSSSPSPSKVFEKATEATEAGVSLDAEGLSELFAKLKGLQIRPNDKVLAGHEAPPGSPRSIGPRMEVWPEGTKKRNREPGNPGSSGSNARKRQ